MRKIVKFMLCMTMGAAMILAASCKKDETSEPTQSSSSGDNGGTNSGEGIYLGVIGFNDQQTIKKIGILNQSTKFYYTQFIDDLTTGNGTGLYYADYTALKMMRECTPPPKLKNVALVTFTDGLDNISLANDSYNPENYGSQAAYREALHNMIVNEKIHGHKVAAYTIGLKGNDVTDNNLFMETLQKLASSNNNVFQVSNMNEAIQRFNEIAANLNNVSSSVNLGVNVPGGYDDGQLLRFTFDNASAATNSSRYIEATYRRNNGRTLENITYHGLAQGPTSISSTSSQGAYYNFLFEDLKYTDGSTLSQSDINRIMLWKRTSTGGWDRESEFDPASSSTITVDKHSALIMLVLDCTNSLGNDFVSMQRAGKTFVSTLVNPSGSGDNPGGGGDNPGGGTTPGGEWVDLGLPSGLLWASHNVGATSPEGYGNYYAWGETATKSTYNWSTYAYGNAYNQLTKYCNNSSSGLNGFTDNLTILQPGDDAATANMGNGARTPTKEEWQELIDNTTSTWTSRNGVNGRLFTASNGNGIFLPAAGSRWDDGLGRAGGDGGYWSSSLRTDYPGRAWYFYFNSSDQDVVINYRHYGFSVRAVRQN